MADLKAANTVAANEAVDLLEGADGFAEVYPETSTSLCNACRRQGT